MKEREERMKESRKNEIKLAKNIVRLLTASSEEDYYFIILLTTMLFEHERIRS
jgi:hypothetical protein